MSRTVVVVGGGYECAKFARGVSADPGITEEIIGRWFATGGGVLDMTPDDGASARLEELFPPPGPNGVKPAPEAYAW